MSETLLPQHPDDDSIDLRRWFGKILANWYWFAISVFLFGSAAYILTRYTERTYEVSAKMLISDGQGNQAQNFLLQQNLNFGMMGNRVSDQMEILKSWTLHRRALNDLPFEISYKAIGRFTERHLYDNVPFRVTVGANKDQYVGEKIKIEILSDSTYQFVTEEDGETVEIAGTFNQPFHYQHYDFILRPNPQFSIGSIPRPDRTNQYCFMINNLDRLAYDLMGKLKMDLPDKFANVILLSSRGPSARQEADYLNGLMREFIQMELDLKNENSKRTMDFIDDQLSGIGDTLKLSENALRDFRASRKVIDISAEGQALMNQVQTLSQEKAVVDAQVNYYEYLLDYLQTSDQFTSVMAPSTMGINDPMLTGLINQLVTLSNEKTKLEISARKDFPAISRINLQLKANLETLEENVRNILTTARRNQEEVNRRISRLNQDISRLPETERQLLTFERRFKMQEEMYTFLMQRRAEAGIVRASNLPDQRIIDQARSDSAIRIAPKAMMNYAIGLLLGLFLPLLILILRSYFKVAIEDREDIEKEVKTPIIGMIGHNRHDVTLPAVKYPRSSVAESFRAVRTNLQFSLIGEGKKSIMVTSSTSGEGKSFVAHNLAGIFAASKKKV
ncbi:MAG: GNVR domain-containing protein, partial [Bacteroidales bacterium]